MIDPVLVGYIELNQAVLRRAADISDREYQERMHEQMRRFRSLVQKGNEQSQNEAEIEHENHNTDPATLLWGKRELAINDLYAALSDGSLLALVRDPASGQLFQLTASDWRGAVFWRDIIVSGVVRSPACEEIERHNGRRVLIDERTLIAWLKKMTERKLSVFDDDCRARLEREMRANPQRTQKTKDYWCDRAVREFGVSERAFNHRIWPNAIRKTGAQWSHAGRPSKI
ncbi:MAG: hypothetical protein ACXW6T_23250 [Candidatus Binatia bacterium]